MPSAYYYRNEAERCRRLAAEDQPQSAASGRLRKLAEEYDQLAQAFEASDRNEGRAGPRSIVAR
jgi:hypothetical protein